MKTQGGFLNHTHTELTVGFIRDSVCSPANVVSKTDAICSYRLVPPLSLRLGFRGKR